MPSDGRHKTTRFVGTRSQKWHRQAAAKPPPALVFRCSCILNLFKWQAFEHAFRLMISSRRSTKTSLFSSARVAVFCLVWRKWHVCVLLPHQQTRKQGHESTLGQTTEWQLCWSPCEEIISSSLFLNKSLHRWCIINRKQSKEKEKTITEENRTHLKD